MMDGKYFAVYLSTCLEGVVEDSSRLLELFRTDYLDSLPEGAEKPEDERFDLMIKFDTYYLTLDGRKLTDWSAINLPAL